MDKRNDGHLPPCIFDNITYILSHINHNIIQIQNNAMWNWQYYAKYSIVMLNVENILYNIASPA